MDSQWLKAQFSIHQDKSKTDLAARLGLEPSAISKILSGGRQIKAPEYMIMREFFGMPSDGASAVDRGPHSYTIKPLENSMKESADEAGQEWIIPSGILSARTSAPPDQIRIFTVRETAMEPDFRQGEHVLVDVSDMTPTPPGVFVISDGFGQMIRHCTFVPLKKPPVIQVSAKSKSFEAQILKPDEFTIIGRVIAKLQMV